jgi:acyl-CoA reductase-like NAD-dependent aldehyde dehydrogenase
MMSDLKMASVCVNSYGLKDPAVPPIGQKASGNGSESGVQQLDAYLPVKLAWVNHQ